MIEIKRWTDGVVIYTAKDAKDVREAVPDFVEARTQYSREAIHLCRSWNPPDPFVDDCPCAKAPCGMVDGAGVDPDCDQHGLDACKTIRGNHLAKDCPACQPETGQRTSDEGTGSGNAPNPDGESTDPALCAAADDPPDRASTSPSSEIHTGLSGYLDGRPDPDESDQRYEDALTELETAPTPSPDRVNRVAMRLYAADTDGTEAEWNALRKDQQEGWRNHALIAIAALQPGPDEVVVTLTRGEAQCLSDRGTEAEIRWGRSKEEAFHRAWNKLDAALTALSEGSSDG